jgi:hypothetical protein
MFSILQFWLEKCLDELAQFKIKLKFGRAHQLVKIVLWLGFELKE